MWKRTPLSKVILKKETLRRVNIGIINLDIKSFNNKLADFRLSNERRYQKELNTFIIEFQSNVQHLQAVSSLFEQKTVFEIEKLKNSILEVLNTDVTTKVKKEVIFQKLKEMNELLTGSFKSIRENINNYEQISDNRIKRTQSDFENNLDKFLL
jgi:hypothetical protein